MREQERLVSAHHQRLREIDPTVRDPATAALLDGEGEPYEVRQDTELVAAAVATETHVQPGTLAATWNPLDGERLTPVVGAAPAQAMDQLVARWEGDRRDRAAADVASITWPSADTEPAAALHGRGLSPAAILATRGLARTTSGSETAGIPVRPATRGDLEQAAELYLEQVRYDAQFGSEYERSDTHRLLRQELRGRLETPAPSIWVAEAGRTLVGLALVSPPGEAMWIAPRLAPGSVAYFDCLSVRRDARGQGIGSALAHRAHAELANAGARMCALHYGARNPLSAPFWARLGYQPRWTAWRWFAPDH